MVSPCPECAAQHPGVQRGRGEASLRQRLPGAPQTPTPHGGGESSWPTPGVRVRWALVGSGGEGHPSPGRGCRGGEESPRDGRPGFPRRLSHRSRNLGLTLDCRVRTSCLASSPSQLENLRKHPDCSWLRHGPERVVEYLRAGWRTGPGTGQPRPVGTHGAACCRGLCKRKPSPRARSLPFSLPAAPECTARGEGDMALHQMCLYVLWDAGGSGLIMRHGPK